MKLALEGSFGSVDRWHAEFAGLGRALGGGPGWLRLSFSARDGTLVHQSSVEQAHIALDSVPILTLEMHGQVPPPDPGAAAAAQVDVFMQGIDWADVYARYQAAVQAAAEPYAAHPDDVAGALVVDVRRAAVFEQARTVLPGARWRDPAAVGRWATEMPRQGEVIVYCVYGHEVGRATALRLRAAGVDARYLAGGIDGWHKSGRPLVGKAAACGDAPS